LRFSLGEAELRRLHHFGRDLDHSFIEGNRFGGMRTGQGWFDGISN
jgi:hypothetical protein